MACAHVGHFHRVEVVAAEHRLAGHQLHQPGLHAGHGVRQREHRPASSAIDACVAAGQLHQLFEFEHIRPHSLIGLTDAAVLELALQSLQHSLGDIFHPHGLKKRMGASQGNHRQKLLKLGKHIEKLVLSAKDHAGPQHGQVQAGMVQQLLTTAFAAQVHRGQRSRVAGVSPQSADMHQATHATGLAGTGNFVGQLHMRLVKSRLVALQDGHQVDHCVMALHQCFKRRRVMDVGLQNGERGQHGDGVGMRPLARGHGDPAACADKLFTDMAADKAGTAQNEDFFHVPILLQTPMPRLAAGCCINPTSDPGFWSGRRSGQCLHEQFS